MPSYSVRQGLAAQNESYSAIPRSQLIPKEIGDRGRDFSSAVSRDSAMTLRRISRWHILFPESFSLCLVFKELLRGRLRGRARPWGRSALMLGENKEKVKGFVGASNFCRAPFKADHHPES